MLAPREISTLEATVHAAAAAKAPHRTAQHPRGREIL